MTYLPSLTQLNVPPEIIAIHPDKIFRWVREPNLEKRKAEGYEPIIHPEGGMITVLSELGENGEPVRLVLTSAPQNVVASRQEKAAKRIDDLEKAIFGDPEEEAKKRVKWEGKPMVYFAREIENRFVWLHELNIDQFAAGGFEPVNLCKELRFHLRDQWPEWVLIDNAEIPIMEFLNAHIVVTKDRSEFDIFDDEGGQS